MSGTKTRKVPSADFKAKIALEAVRESKTLNKLSQEFGICPVQVSQRKLVIWFLLAAYSWRLIGTAGGMYNFSNH